MAWTIALWVLAGLCVLVGIAGTALPALPGPVLVFVGLLLGAWADGFVHVGAGWLTLLGLMAALAYGVDFAAGAFGVNRVGASRRAVAGAVLGGLVGLFFGLPGLLLGPFVGAVIGEYTVQRDLARAGRAGAGAWLGVVLGVAGKLAIVLAMVGMFGFALLG